MARHANERVNISPLALMVGADLGMTTVEMKNEIVSLHKALAHKGQDLLLGGFNFDIIAIAATAVLRLEEQYEEQLHPDRVRAIVSDILSVCHQALDARND